MAATLQGVVTQVPPGAAKYCCTASRAGLVAGKGPAQAGDHQAAPGRKTPAGTGGRAGSAARIAESVGSRG